MSKIFDITLHGVLIFEHITIKYTVLKKFQRENDQNFLCLDNSRLIINKSGGKMHILIPKIDT